MADDDLDARRSRYMPAPAPTATTPPADMPTITVTAPKVGATAEDDLDARRGRYQQNTGSVAQTENKPLTDVSGDRIFPAARAAISQDPNSTYGDVVPLKKDNTTGQISLAWPSSVHLLANGLLDLVEGPRTGTVTPEASNALLMGHMMRPGFWGPVRFGQEAESVPFSKTQNTHSHVGFTKYGDPVYQERMPNGRKVNDPYYYTTDDNGVQVKAPFKYGSPVTAEELNHPDFDPEEIGDDGDLVYPDQEKPANATPPPVQKMRVPRISPEMQDKIAKGIGAVLGAGGGAYLGGGTEALVGGMVGPYIGDLMRPAISRMVGPATRALVGQTFDPRNLLALQPWRTFGSDGTSPTPAPSYAPQPAAPTGNQILLPQYWPGA